MKRQMRRFLGLFAAGVSTAACTDRTTPSTLTAPNPPRASVDAAAFVQLQTLACDFTALKADARAYASSNQDALFTIIGDLQSLSKNGPNAAATSKVFDALARLAAMRGTPAQNTGGVNVVGAPFDRLTHRFLGCAEAYIVTGAQENNFAGATGPGWMYEVRGGAADATTGVYERGAVGQYWVTETIGNATWAQTLNVTSPAAVVTHRALIYGFHPANFATNDPQISRFEHFTVPAITGGALTLNPGVNIGLCAVPVVNPTLRVQHINEVLTYKGLQCTGPVAFARLSTSSVFASVPTLVGRALGMFAPQPLHASMLLGAVGGGKGVLSPSAVIDIRAVTPSFAFPIVNGNNSTPLKGNDGNPVTVNVTTQGGTPLPGVIVTLAVQGNNSVIAFFSDNGAAATATVQRTTDANGVATFNGVSLTKAGGYTLVATGTFDTGPNALTSAGVASNAFNIQNK
jgi:hypothetical protein